MNPSLLINYFDVVMTTNKQGLRTWLRDSQGQGEAGGRIRLGCKDASDGKGMGGEDFGHDDGYVPFVRREWEMGKTWVKGSVDGCQKMHLSEAE